MFQKMMSQVVGDMLFVKVYPNNAVRFLRNVEKLVEHNKQIVELVASLGPKLKIWRSEFAKKSASLLGHVVSRQGVQVDDSKLCVIKDTPRSRNRTKLQSFLRFPGYYRRLRKRFASISATLHALTLSKKEFIWTEEASVDFMELNQTIWCHQCWHSETLKSFLLYKWTHRVPLLLQ